MNFVALASRHGYSNDYPSNAATYEIIGYVALSEQGQQRSPFPIELVP